MKKNLFITIMTLAALAMPMLSSCSSDDDNATVLPTDPDTPSPLDDAVQALYKSTWYLVGYAESDKYTQVGTGVGDPLFNISFDESGQMEGKCGFNSMHSDFTIDGYKIAIGQIIITFKNDTDPFGGKYLKKVGLTKTFGIREDGLLKLAESTGTYLLFSTTRDTKTAWNGPDELLNGMGLERAE